MAIGASVATRCLPCMAHHAHNALLHDPAKEKMLDVAAIGVEFGGCPASAMVRDNLLGLLDEMIE